MTPRESKEYEKRENERLKTLSRDWHYPISKKGGKLAEALDEMQEWKIFPSDIPLIIKLIENPNHITSKLFTGAVDLFTHDCIHILLGRGILPKDEAFVIGYTMGSSKKMSRWRRNLFMWCAKHLYPKEHKFGEEERFVFNMGVVLGGLCGVDLSKVKFNNLDEEDVPLIRKKLKIETKLLRHCYSLEKSCFPDSKESSRLLKFS